MASSADDPSETGDSDAGIEVSSDGRTSSSLSGNEGPVVSRAFVAALESWFEANARDLPWRRRRTPWRSLVSELMLQQTQVSRIAARFEDFMARFPTPRAMVEAGEDRVLAAWEGLGYYRRARLLHAAAERIVERHDGEVPSTTEALESLPGVGKYTAGAVASIVFGARVPIVDGNVVRVASRVLGLDRRADDPELVADAWTFSEELVRLAADPARCNEGLMELGATVCTPRGPDCSNCPVAESCVAATSGEPDAIPRPKIRPVRQVVHVHLALIERAGRILLEQRPAGGLWGGLWQPVGVESSTPMTPEAFRRALPLTLVRCDHLESRRRQLTHRTVHLEVYRATTRARAGRWFDREACAGLGMARPVRDVLDRHLDPD